MPLTRSNLGRRLEFLDGDVVVLRQGKPDFRLLLSRNQASAPLKISALARTLPATYLVFDLLYDRFETLLALPLWERAGGWRR
jgi:ATP-dependent DNA ligase